MFKVLLPRRLVPSLKVTAPIGVPAKLMTFAVRITAWPTSTGLFLVVRKIAVLVSTSCETTALVDWTSLGSPATNSAER